jgi:aspartate/methionine/tyrosine aminotransferase
MLYPKFIIEATINHMHSLATYPTTRDIRAFQETIVAWLTQRSHSGLNDFRRCLASHSLSKRSNILKLHSGFVAGDAHIIEQFLHYRIYHGCALPPATQAASIAA